MGIEALNNLDGVAASGHSVFLNVADDYDTQDGLPLR